MLKITSILILMFIFGTLKSQNNNDLKEDPEITLRKSLNGKSIKTKGKADNNAVMVETKSAYNNWERQILDAMKVSEIPKEFPTYTVDLTDEQYKATIFSWANKNPEYFK